MSHRWSRCKSGSSLLVLWACLWALPCGFAEPRNSWSLEDRVPDSTLALLTLEDVGSLGERFERTAIAGLFREPEMQAFAAPILEALGELVGSEQASPFGDASPLVVNLIEQLQGLRGQIAIALVDMDMERGDPSVALSLDFGPHVGDFAQFLERMRMQLDPQGQAIGQEQRDGRTWWRNVGDGPPVTATTVDTAFVLATDPTLLHDVAAGAASRPLSAHPAFQAVRTKVSGGGDLALMAYANVPGLVSLFASQMDDDTAHIADALGLNSVTGAGYGMAFRGDGFMDSFVLHAPPGGGRGLLDLVDLAPYKPDALRFAPANSFYFNESSVDLAQLLPRIRTLVTRVHPAALEDLDAGLAHLRGALGVDLEKEVLAGLAGPTAAWLAMPDTGGLFPELAVLMKVKDPAAYEAVFERLANGIAGTVSEAGDVIATTRTLDYRGKRLHLFDMQAARGREVVPFTPTWTLLGDWLAITLVPHAMKEIVLRQAADTPVAGGGLAAQEDFRSLLGVMPPQAGELTYLDLQAVMNLLYDTAVPVLQTAVKPNLMGRDVPFTLDWAQLPAARTVRPYFRSLATFSTWNQDGVALQMHGPIPMAGVLVVAVAAAMPFFMMRGVRAADAPFRAEVVAKPRDGEPMGAAVRRAHVQADQLGGFVRAFILTENRMPGSIEELEDAGILDAVPDDPWGRPFVVRVLDEKARRFQVVSAGPDGEFDTDDDVRSGS